MIVWMDGWMGIVWAESGIWDIRLFALVGKGLEC